MTNKGLSIPDSLFAKVHTALVARLPKDREIFNVYSVIVVFVYSWSLYSSFWKIPSWIYFLNFGEILSVYAYMFSIDLMESLLLLIICLSFSLVFPARWWKQLFIPRSLSFIIIFLGSLMLRLYFFGSPYYLVEFTTGQRVWWLVTSLLLVLGVWIVPAISWSRNMLAAFADRCSVFVYVFIPLSLLSLGIVLYRNIAGVR